MAAFFSFFLGIGGKISEAVANAERSMSEIEVGDRAYTYSEFGRLMKKMKGLER